MSKRKSNDIFTTPTQDASPMTAPDAPRRIKIRRIGLAPAESDARKTLNFGSPDVAPTFRFGWQSNKGATSLATVNYNADFDGGLFDRVASNKPKPISRYVFTKRLPRVLITSTPQESASSAPTKARQNRLAELGIGRRFATEGSRASLSETKASSTEAKTIPNSTYFLRSRRDRLLNGFNDWYNEQTSPFALRKATFCTSVHTTNSLIASSVTAYQLYHSVLAACTERDAPIEAMVEKIESLANQPQFPTPQFGNPTETSNHRHILHLGAYTRAIEILEAHMKFTQMLDELAKEVPTK